ncbi:substrate-binding periplasmic protein [Leptolyngbya iicbica]|nr:transporter substrate-binding domain-containing protein [Leptolyngbya sp. LK]
MAPSAIAAQQPTLIAQTNRSTTSSDRPSREAATDEAKNGATEITLMPPDIQRIMDRGKLIVAVLGTSNAPFFMADDNGQAAGLDIQLAQALADQLGVDLELNRSPDTFNAVVDTVYYRGADMAISKISRTMKRAVRVRFSHPYLTMRQGLLINRLLLAQQTNSDNVIETIRELTGDVGVIKGSSYVGFLQQKFPQATIVELESWEDIVTAVSQGEILAGYRDELEIKKVVKTKPDAALQLKTAVLTDTQDALAMVFPWESTHLLAFADQYLDTLDAEYTVDSILEEFASYLQTQPLTP